MTEFEQVLMNRDGLTKAEAREQRATASDDIYAILAECGSYDEVEDYVAGEYGLEMDYILDLI